MIKSRTLHRSGFTVVELLIVIVVIGIIAGIVIVSYTGMQRRAASSSVMKALAQAGEMVEVEAIRYRTPPVTLPDSVSNPNDVELTYKTDAFAKYNGLSPVQNGVLFYDICKELVADPQYSTIHAKNGSNTSTAVMGCDSSISRTNLMIKGWDSKTWTAPLTQATIQTYMDSVPYDSWWTDRQDVIRGFYTALMSRYSRGGGVWPITSFWDPWATSGNGGVIKEPLPASTSATMVDVYCIAGVHTNYPDVKYIITSEKKTPHEGVCI